MSYNRQRSRSPRRPKRSRFTDVNHGEDDKDILKSLETVKNAQTSKVDRKLYVGNLPAGITQSQLVDLLNTALINKKLNAYPGSPVLSAWISQDGHYAFVEFRSIEEANLAFSLNNYPILGQNLKVGRPKTYMGLQPASATDRNTLMGGYTLPTISAFANITDVNKQGPLKPMKVNLSSQILCIHSIVPRPDLDNDETYNQVCKDFSEEAEDLGQIQEIYVPRTGRSAGNVYLEYSTVQEAKSVRGFLNGRTFDGKILEISYVPFQKFKERDIENTSELQVFINA